MQFETVESAAANIFSWTALKWMPKIELHIAFRSSPFTRSGWKVTCVCVCVYIVCIEPILSIRNALLSHYSLSFVSCIIERSKIKKIIRNEFLDSPGACNDYPLSFFSVLLDFLCFKFNCTVGTPKMKDMNVVIVCVCDASGNKLKVTTKKTILLLFNVEWHRFYFQNFTIFHFEDRGSCWILNTVECRKWARRTSSVFCFHFWISAQEMSYVIFDRFFLL